MSSISRIDHIAIAVHSIEQVRSAYEALGLEISHIEELPERGIKTAFIKIGESQLELIEALHPDSEISSFLTKRGPGLHHIALHTPDLPGLENKLKKQELSSKQPEIKLIYPEAQSGAHNTRVNFIHPKSTQGVLIELVGA